MRLGQLARKLALRPAEIVDFLAENNIRIADGANARLENDHVTLIMKRFVPGWVETSAEELEKEEEVVLPEVTPEVSSPELSAEEQTPTVVASEPEEIKAEETVEPAEVIRAPKVELSGLKVLGKIDLPEPKKKEEQPKEEASAIPEEGRRERRENRRQFDANKKRHQRPEKNPVALQREREQKEAQKKHEEQLARDKEKRTQKYLKNYKAAPPTKAAKLVKEDVMEMTQQEMAEPPKTILGKFLRWLKSAP